MSDVLKRYLEKLIHDHRRIDARGVMQVNRMIELTLDEVFIDLTVRMGKAEKFELPREIEPQDGEERDWRRERYAAPQVETGISSAELWQRHAAWVLLGDPGAGKTTLLKHFALQQARACQAGDGYLPILIPLRFLAAEWSQQSWQAKDAVLNYLANQGLVEMGFEDPIERAALFTEFKNALANGRALLLFDGLDEQRDANIQRNTVQAIESVLETHPNNRCLVSSRIIGYDAAPLGAGFHTATLEPFNDEQMAAFFQQWIYAVEQQEDIDPDENTKKRAQEKADDLIAQIQANAGIRTLAANPLLCTIIGLIRRQGATLPTIRVELYKLCIDTFIFHWELQKRRRTDQQNSLDKDQTQAVLEEIALYLHERCTDNRASHEQLAQVIREFLVKDKGLNSSDATHKAEQLLNLIRDVSGLLIDRGNAEYGFFHLTFQEYLTARAITRRRKDIDRYLGQHLFEPRWREVIRLAAAHQGMKDAETGSEFIAAIRRHPHPREALMHYAFRMAFLCLKETKVELDTSDEMMREWVRIYLAQPELQWLMNGLMRQDGLEIRYRDGAVQPLLDALKDEDSDVRRAASQALANFKAPAVMTALLAALKDKEGFVRDAAAQALANFKAPAVMTALLDALKDKEGFVRYDAAQALANFKDPAVMTALLNALKDEDSVARYDAAQALANFKDPAVMTALLDALKDKNSDVRHAAAQALGNFKDSAVMTALLNALKDEYSVARHAAAQALANFKDPIVMTALLDALKDKEGFVRHAAAQALENFKYPAVMTALLDALKDKESFVCYAVAQALANFKDPAVMTALLDALKDKNSDVRLAAAQALGNFKDPTVLLVLLDALKDENSTVRFAAAQALGNFKDPAVMTVLLDALKDENSAVRHAAAQAFGNFKDPAVMIALLEALNNNKGYIRFAVLESIEQIDLGSPLCPN